MDRLRGQSGSLATTGRFIAHVTSEAKVGHLLLQVKCEKEQEFETKAAIVCVIITLTVQLASTKRFSAFKSRCKIGGDALDKHKMRQMQQKKYKWRVQSNTA